MNDWTPPNVYPYVDSNPRARCWGPFHGKATVRTVMRDSARLERYDCRCGKYMWLSAADGYPPLVRFRTEARGPLRP